MPARLQSSKPCFNLCVRFSYCQSNLCLFQEFVKVPSLIGLRIILLMWLRLFFVPAV